MMILRDFALRVLAVLAVAGAAACSDEPAAPSRSLRVEPANHTLEGDEEVEFTVFTGDAQVYYRDVQVSNANANVANPCGNYITLRYCARTAGTTTVTFQFDGLTATARLTVLPPRFVLKPDSPLVVGHRQGVAGRYTDRTRPLVAFRITDTAAVGIAGVGTNSVSLELKRAGTFSLEAISVSDTTLRDTIRLTVVAPTVAALTTSGSTIASGQHSLDVRIAIRDQMKGVLHGLLPSATIVEGSSVARIVSITPATDTGATAIVRVQPVSGGVATIRVVTPGASPLDVPIVQRSVAPDSGVAIPSGVVVPVFANDLGNAGARIIASPHHGVATLDANGVRYVPSRGYYGLDSILYASTSGTRTDTTSVRFASMPGPFVPTIIGPAATTALVGVNNAGQVAATVTRLDGFRRAIRWTAGAVDSLQYNGLSTQAAAIDNAGNVLGWGGEGASRRVLLWRAGTATPVDLLGPAAAAASELRMSSGGTIAFRTGPFGMFVGRIRTGVLDSVGGRVRTLAAVNDRGDILFDALTSPPETHLLSATGIERTLAIASHGQARGMWLTNDGGVIGEQSNTVAHEGYYLIDGTVRRFLWQIFGAWVAGATQINSDGWILGGVGNASTPALFVLNAAAPLDALIDPSLHIVSAIRLNDVGQFIATFDDASGTRQAGIFTSVHH